MSTATLRLTEPYVLLIGATEHERALARRRRREAGTPRQTPGNSPPNSRPPSPPPGISAIVEGNFVAPFIPPSSRGGAGARGMSPVPLLAAGGSRSASRSRTMEGTTTGTGTTAEADAADEPPPAMLRGLLTITLAKPSRIRSINVRLRGVSRTDWPEGIGPRRLDVMEETQLFSKSFNFFTASTNPPSERRAASIGPGIREQGDLDGRGRTGARRATSMMPTRELSIGLVYPSRDSRIHEGESEQAHDTIEESEEHAFPRSTLSRITSSTQLDEMDDSPPPIQPWEPSPAYEDGNSPSSSPTAGPSNHLNRVSSVDSFHLRSNSPHSDRFAASPRSPLNRLSFTDRQTASPAPASPATTLAESAIDESAHARPESDSTLSTIPTTDSVASNGTDTSGWNGAPMLESTESRGRPTNRLTNGDTAAPTSSTIPPSTQSTQSHRPSPPIESMRSAASPSPAPSSSSHHRDPSLGGSIGPGSLRGMKAPPAARSASSRPSRFSLGALGDALRGKSMSRAREAREASTQRDSAESRGRGRAESPDSSRGDQDQSRGRKTALKVLRDALTSGVDVEDGESDDDEAKTTKSWREFRAGTYTYPISIPVPASLPPSISSDFGAVSYYLKATVNRAGALTSNLTSTAEVTLVSCPGSDDTEESESIVVERFWESQMRYHIALSGKSFPIGGRIPISIRLNPLAKIRLYRITAVLEQRTNYYASNKRLTRHETPKKFSLLKIEHPESPLGKTVKRDPLLPIFSDEVDAISVHPLKEWFINPTSSDDSTPSCLDPIGPWNLESTIQLPDCAEKLTFTTAHDRANITVSHILKIMLRVERGDDDFLDSKGKRKLWDVIIETPIHILSCRCAQTALPAYTAANGSTTIAPSLFAQRPCTFNHTTPISRSNASQNGVIPVPPEVATVEQTLLFARLVAGEVTAAGEIPPSYTAVAVPGSTSGARRSGRSMERSSSSSSSIMTARGRASSRGGGSSGIGGSSPGPSTSRGRSGSVDVVVSNGGGARTGRSLSIVSGLTR